MRKIHSMVEETPEGGYVARFVGADIVTEPDDLPNSHAQVTDAAHRHFGHNKLLSLIS